MGLLWDCQWVNHWEIQMGLKLGPLWDCHLAWCWETQMAEHLGCWMERWKAQQMALDCLWEVGMGTLKARSCLLVMQREKH